MLEVGKCYITPWTRSTTHGLLPEGSLVFILELMYKSPKRGAYYYKTLKPDGTIIVLVVSSLSDHFYWKKVQC